MAHRQKNRDGTPIRHELTAANDCDTAHREVLRRMETYGKDPDATLEEVSRDTVLLLRALNHRVRHFQARILADIKIRESYDHTPRSQSWSDNPPRTRDHHTRTSLRENPSERIHGTDADETNNPWPARRPAENGKTQPITGQPALHLTTTNEHLSPNANRNHPHTADQTHQEVRPITETDASITNPADGDDTGTETRVATTSRHGPQISKLMTSTSDNENGDIAITPERKTRKRDHPNGPGPQRTMARTNKNLRSSPDGEHVTAGDDTTAYNEYSPTNKQAMPPIEGEKYGTRPPRRPKDRDTLGPETEVDTRHAQYQGYTTIRPYGTTNREEPHENRDVNLVPDRGKEPNKAVITKSDMGKLPPKLSDSRTYKL